MGWNIITSIIAIGVVISVFVVLKMLGDKRNFNPSVSLDLVKNGALLIDVRSPEEYHSEHIKGAININYTTIKNNHSVIEKLTNQDKRKSIVLYCRSGRRSGIAKKELEELGYTNVVNHGGIDSWIKKDDILKFQEKKGEGKK